ncbi:phage shock protein operon transcriptional activator [Hyphococcus formosus]|uniref:phage shock protein operon transcriptional activator n=1 Tax=Hyphococcus formosus TaxID=3143534 RepID=UPI00398AA5EB
MSPAPTPPELIGQSQAFLDALDHASSVAEIDRPVLVMGERGSGKELIAARIHFLSKRWDGPLVKVNCAAMNEALLESELFGHEAGAFTGATKRHQGRFERAEGGTLFLDEIASASLRVQEKLLRVIEYGEYERIGGEETRIADVRIIAAANTDLRAQASEDKFRADLLDRLAFDVVAAPALRNRPEDIPLLASHFGNGAAIELGIGFPGFTPEAIAALRAHRWPGNVRELKNVAERAVFHWAMSDGHGPIDEIEIDPFEKVFGAINSKSAPTADLTTTTAPNGKISDLRAHLNEIERSLVRGALEANGGNQKRAGDALSLTYDQIRGLVKKHGLTR